MKRGEYPFVSVIVPVYNVEKYLSECLDSIINQTLKNIEILCINDGSTDRSLSILNRYAALDSRIKVISKENAGYGHTMNVGTQNAKGEYLGIVESDDYVGRHMFETLYTAAKKSNADIVKSDYFKLWSLDNKKRIKRCKTCPSDFFYNRKINAKEFKEVFDFEMMNWTGIYRTDFIRNNDISYNETPGASFQDNGFWFQTLSLAKTIFYINKAFYYYRQDNPNSSINDKSKVDCMFEEYAYIKKFLKNNKEVFADLYPVFLKKKFYNLRFSWDRVDKKYRLDFLKREKKEYEADLAELKDKISEMDHEVLKEMNKIIDSPELYYYDITMWKLENKYREVHDDLLKIRASEELKKGTRIRDNLKIKKDLRFKEEK